MRLAIRLLSSSATKTRLPSNLLRTMSSTTAPQSSKLICRYDAKAIPSTTLTSHAILCFMLLSSNQGHSTVAPGVSQPDTNTTSSSSATAKDVTNPQQAAQFNVGTLSRQDLDPDPFKQFHKWFSDPALQGTVPETVTLSTAELPSGRVSSRMVYLKELDDRGWVVYSNWGTSRKAKDVESNPYAALCFWWKPLERQVRVEGRCERLTAAESQVYYDTRARGSRIGAWASQQTSVLKPTGGGGDDGRAMLDGQVSDVEKRFEGIDHIPVPDFWGGLRVVPDVIEFWQGRENRLHDRFRYSKVSGTGQNAAQGEWKIERLSP